MELYTQTIEKHALFYNGIGLNVLPIGANKAPALTAWKEWMTKPQSNADVTSFDWTKASGVGLVAGIGRLRCFDFDKVNDDKIVWKFLKDLQLPKSYKWIEKTGSGKGYHIFFLCDDFDFERIGFRGSAKKDYKPSGAECDHIELRWKECQTVIAPTTIGERKYTWLNGDPDSLPADLDAQFVIDTVKNNCKIDKDNKPATTAPVEMLKSMSNVEADIYATKPFLSKIDNYEDWYRAGLALVDYIKSNADGRRFAFNFFIDFSLANEKYKDTEDNLFNKMQDLYENASGEIKLNTLFQIAKKYGYKTIKEQVETTENNSIYETFAGYIGNLFTFRFNKLNERTEYKKKGDTEWKKIGDRTANTIVVMCEMQGHKISRDKVLTYIESDFIPEFNPLTHYFTTLPQYDSENEPDYFSMLADTVITQDQEEIKYWMLKKWFLNAVNGALSDTEVNSYCLVMQGEGHLGKTTWYDRICPDDLRAYYRVGLGNMTDKDTRIAICNTFLINLDELQSLNKTEQDFVKYAFSNNNWVDRDAYAHFREDRIRRSSFCGSINAEKFLKDPTGNRRWLVLTPSKLDWKGINTLPIDRLWAQAYYYWLNKVDFTFNKEERDAINANNKRYEIAQLEEELILINFRPDPKKQKENFKPITTIMDILQNKARYDITTQRIGNALAKLKFPAGRLTVNGTRSRGYYAIDVSEQNIVGKLAMEDRLATEVEVDQLANQARAILFDEEPF